MADTDLTTTALPNANLSGLRIPELRALAQQLGIRGLSGMRKGAIIDAIQAATSGAGSASTGRSTRPGSSGTAPAKESSAPATAGAHPKAAAEVAAAVAATDPSKNPQVEDSSGGQRDQSGSGDHSGEDSDSHGGGRRRRGRRGGRGKGDNRVENNRNDRGDRSDQRGESGGDKGSAEGKPDTSGTSENDGQGAGRDQRGQRDGRNNRDQRDDSQSRGRNDRNDQSSKSSGGQQDGNQGNNNQGNNGPGGGSNRNRRDERDDEHNGRRRNRRNRDRNRRNRGGGDDLEVREGDVVQPAAGILDIVNDNAFLRTSGYLPSASDVFLSASMVRKYGLRRGDTITGKVRMPRDGENQNHGGGRRGNRQKFNPLVELDTVNGQAPEAARQRPEFGKLTPLYPNQRLRLETESNILSTRVIDLVMPIGKGQRALIVSPPKAGKTTVLQNIANAISTNNPEAWLMVVLVDERPEEVTDMQRSVKGEVIASTFDRPPSDHTAIAELAIERAKRLVEQGIDVVVLLDSITRLARAYNNCSPASGRILSGGVDSTALYPPKRFLGAARNIEGGGSLTIIATAMVETGSAGDTVIFEEFKGTGNAELKLDRKISERRVFPAIDISPSGTRKDELLMTTEEWQIVHKLRRVLAALEPQPALDLILKQMKKTSSNREFLALVAKTAPGAWNDED